MCYKIIHLLHQMLYYAPHGGETSDRLTGSYHKAVVDRV